MFPRGLFYCAKDRTHLSAWKLRPQINSAALLRAICEFFYVLAKPFQLNCFLCNSSAPWATGSLFPTYKTLNMNYNYLPFLWASLVAQLVKNPPAMWETWVRSLGWEDPLEKGKATHSRILAWRIPWTVWSMGLQRVEHEWATFTHFLFQNGKMNTFRCFFSLRHLNHKKEWNNTICSNMNGPRNYHTKWSEPKTDIIWYHLYVESKINNTN